MTVLDVSLGLAGCYPHNNRRSTMAEQLSGQRRGLPSGLDPGPSQGNSACRTVHSSSLQAPIVLGSDSFMPCNADGEGDREVRFMVKDC